MGQTIGRSSKSAWNFSKRTIEFVSNLDKSDAQLFTNLCCFCWFSGEVLPLVYDVEHEIYGRKAINFDTLTHLDAIGLIRFEALGGFNFQKLSKAIRLNYYGAPINIEFEQEENNTLEIGKVLLTKTGKELAPICGSKKSEEFMDYIVSEWQKKGYLISCPLSQRADAA
ncbi:MAG TPA: DUF2806 domain-containing protein [Pyrinomonadaceae bacterium]|nr:DUF2806 domain-containing protein [Pyrinomonadaceae bacterium]